MYMIQYSRSTTATIASARLYLGPTPNTLPPHDVRLTFPVYVNE